MKKVISLVLVALLMASVAFAVQPLKSPGVGDILGQGKFPSDPHRIFRLVRYIPPTGGYDSTTLVVDSIVIWDTNSDDGVTITTTTTSPDSAVAGITAVATLTPDTIAYLGKTAANSIGSRNWTWLQTYGKAEVRINGTNAVAVGNAMGTSGTAGEADIFVASTSDATKNGNAGFFYDAGAAAADDVECFVRLD